jgi:hypothetical protein
LHAKFGGEVKWFCPVFDLRPGRQAVSGIPSFQAAEAKNLANCTASRLRSVVEISLWSPSPKNGNISKDRRRLSTFLPRNPANWESGDRSRNCKSPPLAGFSVTLGDQFLSGQSAWLGREDSNLDIVNRDPSKAATGGLLALAWVSQKNRLNSLRIVHPMSNFLAQN